jgi:hypothetical protein
MTQSTTLTPHMCVQKLSPMVGGKANLNFNSELTVWCNIFHRQMLDQFMFFTGHHTCYIHLQLPLNEILHLLQRRNFGTQVGYTCNMTDCLPISDVEWKFIFFTVYLVSGLVMVVRRLAMCISSDLNPIKFYMQNHTKDVVFQQKMKTHDAVLCHTLDGANHLKDYSSTLMQATCSIHRHVKMYMRLKVVILNMSCESAIQHLRKYFFT